MTGFLYALVCLIWGSTWLAIKIGLEGVPPLLAAGARFALAAAVLFAIVRARGARLTLTKDDRTCVYSCGFVSFFLSYACVYWAEVYISSGLTAILFSTMPLSVSLLSAFWTRTESLDGRRLAGILVGMLGTALLFWPDQRVSPSHWLGMALALASALAAAINLVTLKKHSMGTDIFVMNALGMSIGAACLLAVSALTESYAGLVWTRANVLSVVYLALFGSVTAFLAYYHLVKSMEASALSLITLIFPLVALALGVAVLGERVTARTLAGVLTVLGGVAVAVGRLPARRRPAAVPPAV